MTIRASGDTMLLVEWDGSIDPVVNQRAITLAQRLRHRLGSQVRDIVPSYCAIGVHYDPLLTDLAALERAIEEESDALGEQPLIPDGAPVDLVVRYGGADGPDLTAVAEWAQCSTAEVIERHSAMHYRVYMLGFVPGFAYLGRVDARIAAPRHRMPRERVAAGSVGIAGEQTGVYPMATPGGWQVIGRTDAVMFDSQRMQPSLLQPGDMVRFVPA